VEPGIAHSIASRHHVGQRNRFGDPVIDHVERVAAAVPSDARVTALLHDLFERCPTAGRRLRDKGLSPTELEALQLLTHAAGEPYETYVRRIADTPGPAGRLARIVKLADLEDHLAHPSIPADAPPYAWAREQLLTARERSVDAAAGTPAQPPRPAVPRSGVASNPPRS
jgi:uncharacterized membrane protein YccC